MPSWNCSSIRTKPIATVYSRPRRGAPLCRASLGHRLDRYVGMNGAKIGMHTFGSSAPLKDLLTKFVFTPDKWLRQPKIRSRNRKGSIYEFTISPAARRSKSHRGSLCASGCRSRLRTRPGSVDRWSDWRSRYCQPYASVSAVKLKGKNPSNPRKRLQAPLDSAAMLDKAPIRTPPGAQLMACPPKHQARLADP